MRPDSRRLTDSQAFCFKCGAGHDLSVRQTVCDACGRPLEVRVALPGGALLDSVDNSIASMWRYHQLLPIPLDQAVSLGEGWTPLHRIDDHLWVKDESVNPTGSFKDRGMSMAVSAAQTYGVSRLVAPSAGNAAVALSAYGSKAGIPVLVVMPDDTPPMIVARCSGYGAAVELVEGDISVAGGWLKAHTEPGDSDVATLREPFRVEGKKTMGYELWEQFGGAMPDVVVYPTGGGTGLVGMWKAWQEMESMGWIRKMPRLVSVQSTGCAPIVKAFEEDRLDIQPWPDPETNAYGLRVPSPIAGFICLRAIRETSGIAIAVRESEIEAATREARDATGIDFCPEAGAGWAATQELSSKGWIGEHDTVLLWNTGSGDAYGGFSSS